MATASKTVKPNALAGTLTKTLKRPITGKMVRGWVRDHVARFSKSDHPEYQSHEYSAAEVKTITAAFAGKTARASAQVGSGKSAKAASKPRTASKPRAVTPPAPPAAE